MKKILEISDSDVGLEPKTDAQFRPRTAARAIVKKKDLIALLHVSKDGYHKLPGGGVDPGESIQEALHREVLEEVGCKIRVLGEVGEILEHRGQAEEIQTSHCFIAEVIEEGEPKFTEKEISEGFELVWVSLDKAIEMIQKEVPTTYSGKFIVKRDLFFLQAAKEKIN